LLDGVNRTGDRILTGSLPMHQNPVKCTMISVGCCDTIMRHSIVLSHYQTRTLYNKFAAGESSLEVSTDLGLSSVGVVLSKEGVRFPEGELLAWQGVETINACENNCFVLVDGDPQKILLYSELSEQVYSLMPTSGAPTMLVSGIPMHRIKGIDPQQDTLEKIKAIKPVVGHVLDTATGLGYTAIESSRTAEHVTTIEVEPAALEIAQLNPWSRALFDNPRIAQLIGDSYNVVERLGDASFTCVIHDPPVFSLAGHLYSTSFYAELYRVLKRRGRLFHYVGNPQSKSGRNITHGVVQRLKQAGFKRVVETPRAFGVVAYK
jgi:predicted methyltransferase